MVRSEGNMSLKNPVTPPGIDPGTVRLVAQRLNHYATPGPNVCSIYVNILSVHLQEQNDYRQDFLGRFHPFTGHEGH